MTTYMVEIREKNIKTTVQAANAVDAIKTALAATFEVAQVAAVPLSYTNSTNTRWRFMIDGHTDGRTIDLTPSRHAKAAGETAAEQRRLMDFIGAPRLFE